MGTKLYGIGTAQNADNVGETIILEGLDDRLKFLRDEHSELDMWRLLGNVSKSKKIFSINDCEDDKQTRCWNHAQVPFLYFEGELADDEDHPNAKAAASLLRFVSGRNLPLQIGASIDGGIAERRDANGQVTEDKEKGKTISKSIGVSLALTCKPANPKCAVFLENDLQKSSANTAAPAIYWEMLKKSEAVSSFNEILTEEFTLWMKLEGLKKSLSDYMGGFTSVKCERCAKSIRFFKATSDMPNCCDKCGSHYNLNQIWKSLNR